MAKGSSVASKLSDASCLSASCSIDCSMSRRSRFSRCSVSARSLASIEDSASKHSMPIDISSSRPAALRRGPTMNPRSEAVACRKSRPATSKSASIPGRARPLRIRAKPAATKMRLLRSRGTTSATVPKATRSSASPRLGSVIPSVLNQPRCLSSARSALST